MKHDFSAYPAGVAGLALLLLRCSAAAFLLSAFPSLLTAPPWPALVLCTIAVAIMLGTLTRIAASLCAAVAVIMLVMPGMRAIAGVPSLLDAAALAMIGPGAFSIDARRFGRRTIHLTD
jgi:putative oxidoreductase